jgi:uncharacterized protein (DUF58 family)
VIGARATVMVGVALVLGGAAFDTPALYVPGVALAVLATGSRAWVKLAARRAAVERLPGPPSVVEQEPYPLRVRITVGFPRPPGGWLLDPLVPVPRQLRAGTHGEICGRVQFPRRGRHRLEPVTLLISDPLGLCGRAVRSREGGRVLVLPMVEPVISAAGGGGELGQAVTEDTGDGAEGPGLDVRTLDSEIDGLRPYRRGSPASRIHWPAVARTGELLERRIVAGADTAPLVVLDASNPPDEESLDKAVRAAASLAVHLARLGGCALLLPDERRSRELDPQLRTWPELHARLALVEATGAPPTVSRNQRGDVFWVTANSRLPRRGAPGPARSSYLVAPDPLAGTPVAFTVAGCRAHPLGLTRRLGPQAGARAA